MSESKQLSHAKDSGWIDLSRLQTPFNGENLSDPFFRCTGLSIALNGVDFILSRVQDPTPRKVQILTFNSIKDEWTLLCTYDCPIDLEVGGIRQLMFVSDPSRNKLFVFASNDLADDLNDRIGYSIKCCDLSTNQWTALNGNCRFTENPKASRVGTNALFVNGVCHSFMNYEPEDSGSLHNIKLMHSILDERAGVLFKQCIIDLDKHIGQEVYPLFVQRLNSILLIQCGSDRIHDPNNWKQRDGEIRIFKLDQQKWCKVDGVSLPFWIGSVVLTADEKNVLMAGWNDMFALDISDERNFKLNKLSTRTPVMRDDIWPTIIRMGDKLKSDKLVIGWTRRILRRKKEQHVELPPLHLLTLISTWILNQEIHYIHEGINHDYEEEYEHHVISMKRLLEGSTDPEE